MTEDIKQAKEEILNAWGEMKSLLDSKDGELQETKNHVAKLNTRIDELETKASAPIRSYVANDIEAGKREAEHKGLLIKAIRSGYGELTKDEKKLLPLVSQSEAKALALSDDTAGGWLAYSELVNDIIKGVINFSPVRQIATVKKTSNRSIRQPVRKGTFAARWVADTATRTETTGYKIGMEDVPNHELYAEIIISEQDLEDSAFDIEGQLQMEASEQFGVSEGAAFVNGSGVGQPEGLLTNSSISYSPSTNASLLTADGFITMFYAIPETYANNATWLMKRATVGTVRTLKDSYGQYLWAPAFGTSPNTILGQPYMEALDMPAVATNAYPVLFGDFKRCYIVVDRVTEFRRNILLRWGRSAFCHFFLQANQENLFAD